MMSDMSQDETISYPMEWIKMFSKKEYIEHLYSAALFGNLKRSRFRSVSWKIFLKVLPENRDEWMQTTRELRNRYEKLLEEYNVDPRTEDVKDISINNPLSSSNLSPWNRYFEDKRMRALIQQDVVRTFPEIEFFRSSEIQKMMINILFVFVSHHPALDYKQGMHELLAPILLVLYNDMQSFLKVSEMQSLDIEVRILLNQNYLEHDAYFMFCQLMERIESWFVMDCNYYEQVEEIPQVTERHPPFPKESLPSTICIIWSGRCRAFDLELYNHLVKMEIAPQIYGIRWLRLLFGREFEIADLLILWDALFSDVEFDLYNYIFVAMLISIRQLLLQGDYASCLNHLMRFPHVESVQFVINLALHLRDPVKYKLPERSNQSSNLLEMQESKPIAHKGFYSSAGLGRAESLLKKNVGGNRPKSLSFTGVSKIWTNPYLTSRGSPMCARPQTSPNERQSKSITAEKIETDRYGQRPKTSPSVSERHSKWDQHARASLSVSERFPKWVTDDQYDSKTSSAKTEIFRFVAKSASSTFPRTSIHNVMESKSHKYRASDLTQTHDNDSDKKSSGKAREMVPLFPPIPDAAPRTITQIPLEIARKMQNYRSENGRMKKKIGYCVQEMAHILPKLHGILESQKIKHETEMISALQSLEKVKLTLEDLDSSRKNSFEDSLSNEASRLTLDSDICSEYDREESASSGAKKSSNMGTKKSGSDSPVSFPDIYQTKN